MESDFLPAAFSGVEGRLAAPAAPIKSALFVDFDNIYIGLSKTDPLAAERFASDPARWLAWLEKGCLDRSTNQVRPRQILIRRCYPNPDAGFRRYRSFFTSAAFSVIDCPSMTRAGKNSADIYMVMDILDTLNHKTCFDEFIIFSGDSDFMPVLLRLRAYDRRTTSLAVDFMPPAYKAACDLVIGEEEFIEEALGLSNESTCGGSAARSRVPVALLKAMAARVYAAACDEGQVDGANLPDILKDFREFRESNNWLGFGTSQRLAEALVCSEPRLSLVRLNAMLYKVVLKTQEIPTSRIPAGILSPVIAPPVIAQPAAPAQVTSPSPVEKTASSRKRSGRAARPSERAPERPPVRPPAQAAPSQARLREQVITLVREVVEHARGPVLLARASQYVVSKLGPQVLETQWAGAGSFKRLLQTEENLGLEITTQPEPGYIFDPARHDHPTQRGQESAAEGLAAEGLAAEGLAAQEPGTEGLAVQEPLEETLKREEEAVFEPAEETGAYPLEALPAPYEDEEDEEEEEESVEEEYEESLPSLEEFTRRVGQVTGAPDLSPREYALVFQGIVAELQQIAQGQKIYNTYQSSKAISEWCAEHGGSISRGDVVLILKGIIFQDGVRFSRRPGSYTPGDLAAIVRKNIKALCRRSRMEISEFEDRLLDEWILGGLEEEENSSPIPGGPRDTGAPQENLTLPEG